MTKNELTEIKYLLFSFSLTLALLFIIALFSPSELEYLFPRNISRTAISWFLGFIVFCAIYGIRQIKLKFSESFPNLILILSAVLLLISLEILASNSVGQKLTITGNSLNYEKNIWNSSVLFFRLFQVIVGISLIYVLYKVIQLYKLSKL